MAKKIVGIEIGNHTLELAICVNGKPQKFIQAELPDNMVRDNQIVSYDAMADFIRETFKEHRINCKKVALTLPDRKLLVRRLNMPLMTISQLKVNLPYEFKMYITGSKDQYVYDYAVIDVQQDEKNPKIGEMDLLAIAVERELLEAYQAMFRRAGLKLAVLMPECLAIKNIIDHYEERNGITGKHDYAVMDLGAETIIIQFFSEGEYDITRTMEFGCYNFIAQAAEINEVDIHIAHLDYEANRQNIQYHERLMPMYDQVAIEIMRIMNFYLYNHAGSDLENVYICGGGTNIKPLVESITRSVDLNVKSIKELFSNDVMSMDELELCPQLLGMVLE
ncbi:type IV pilus assembly protein PilM [Granulicatella balaenopterae]|uniref:Type IV pilus assembly protein PilM n=1 Tax=Granulicatella balaenopterae TaxID=137733 RepID=A0A1H9KR16_9LACT|nr:pilus assembly protein PilM [Granulicatella balaenopterae]SER01552.1 type IV pilus assembly protein PilM [Granulicatella balaenopterae]